MVDVFISYSRTNQEMVRQLAEAVAAEGYSVWWDAELPPHLSYGDVITEKIGAAKAAIVVWSQSAAASEWVRAEADVARGQKKLIQTSIDDVMPPMPFNQIQFASIGDWHGESDHPGWRKVKASLAALCGEGAGGPAEAPERPPRRDPPVAVAAAPAGRGPILALLALLVTLVGAGVAILWMQGREGEREVAKIDPVVPTPAPQARAAAEDPDLPLQPAGAQASPDDEAGQAEEGLDAAPPPDADPTRRRRGEVLPESDTRILTEEDVDDLSRRELFLARNEIFARHGRPFRSPELRRHFTQFSWYRPSPAKSASAESSRPTSR